MRQYFEFASSRAVILITLIVVLFFSLLVFPALPIPGEVLDAKWSYTSDFGRLMDSYGEAGRDAYAWSSLTVDTLFPLLYVTLLSGLLYRFAPAARFRAIAILAVAAGVFDLIENVQIFTMLVDYPDVSMLRVSTAELFTKGKWLAAATSGVIAMMFVAIRCIQYLRGRF